MATFVLIHGGWVAGWCWRGVEQQLLAAGHQVFRPSLTGLGERSQRQALPTDCMSALVH